MAKVNLKQKLAEKGERYAFFAAGGLMLLFMIIGVIQLTDSPDTDAFVNDVDKNTTRITGAIKGPAGEVPDLPEHVRKTVQFSSVKMGSMRHLFFDPIAPNDNLRNNPRVVEVAEIQANFVPAKIFAYDIQDTEKGDRLIAVLTRKVAKDETIDKEGHSEFVKGLADRKKIAPRSKPKAANTGTEGTTSPMPSVESKGEAAKGGRGSSGVVGPSLTAVNPMGGGTMVPSAASEIDVGERYGVEYVPLEPEKLEGKRFAYTIYPQRMVLIQAAFPYKEQIEEYRKAMRLDKPADVLSTPDGIPVFKGYLIQRRMFYPDGKPASDWHYLDIDAHYRDTIFPRKVYDEEEKPELAYVMPPEDAELTMPLPRLLSGKYPECTLPLVLGTIQKFREKNAPPSVPKSTSPLKGEGSIYGRTAMNQQGFGGQPSSSTFVLPKEKGKTKVDPKAGTNQPLADLPDAVLIRLIDNNIEPGRLYQYRIKLLLQNPNWVGLEKDEKGELLKKAKIDLMSKNSDAFRMLLGATSEDAAIIEQRFFPPPDKKESEEDKKVRLAELQKNLDKRDDVPTKWCEMSGFVTVPQEEFLFGVDPMPVAVDPKEPKKAGPALKPGHGFLQIQRWLPIANVGGFKEPVADWIVADVLARKGYPLGGKQFVNLPIWSSEFNCYILRKVPPQNEAQKKEPLRGVTMDPTKPGPSYVVVDVKGGNISERIISRTAENKEKIQDLVDEAATEILLVDEEGRLQVRRSAFDRYLPKRENREKEWLDWVAATEKESKKVDPNSTVTPKFVGKGGD